MSKGLSSVIELAKGGPPNRGGWAGGKNRGTGSDDNSTPHTREERDTTNSTPHTQEERQVDVADFIGSGDEDEDQMVQQVLAIPKEDRNWVEQKIVEQYEKDPSRIQKVIYNPERGEFTDVDIYTQPLGYAGGIASILGLGPFTVRTGFGTNINQKFGGGDGEGRPSRITQQVAAPVVEPEVEVSVTPDSYYATGAGTGTTSLSDLAKINPYLATLYAQTPSPIGQTYEQTMAQMKRQQKERRRLSGLDIFKPVSIVS